MSQYFIVTTFLLVHTSDHLWNTQLISWLCLMIEQSRKQAESGLSSVVSECRTAAADTLFVVEIVGGAGGARAAAAAAGERRGSSAILAVRMPRTARHVALIRVRTL